MSFHESYETLNDCYDDFSVLEAQASFIKSACLALSMLQEADLDAITENRTWEGLGYITADMAVILRKMQEVKN